MINKFISSSPVGVLIVLCAALIASSAECYAKETNQNAGNQPLANVDKIMKQANNMRMDSLVDSKLASNMTNTLNDMAMNLRKMFMENRRLSSQIQEVMSRVQNATGVNATSAMNNLQQQASNMTNMTNLQNLPNLPTLNIRSLA